MTVTANTSLRHPLEWAVFICSVVLNAVIIVGVVFIATRDSAWLKTHPFISSRIGPIQKAVVIAILIPPGVVLLRNTRRALMRGNSIRISAEQMPTINTILESQCQRIGIPPPELYFSSSAISEPAHAYSAWQHDYIVLSSEYLTPNVAEMFDVIEFLLGRELGAIMLGHTKWWDEILVAYVLWIPLLKNPLLHVRTFSKDRYGAFLAPHGIRGLVVQASGRLMLEAVNIREHLECVERRHGLWLVISEMTREVPNVSHRISALYKTGLFRIEDDVARFNSNPRQAA